MIARSEPEALHALEHGALHPFSSWPVADIPRVAAGVYTVWDGPALVYVGMSGRSLTEDALVELRLGTRSRGLWTRLNSHASGRRSGDQFCVYICDRLVIPTLTPAQLLAVGSGALSLDTPTREYIRTRLTFRCIEVPSGVEAAAVERAVRAGALAAGPPLLNPVRGPSRP